jgi:hypothetical protein
VKLVALGRDYSKGVLAVHAKLASPGHLSTYPQSSTARELHALMRLRGRDEANAQDWRGHDAAARAVATSGAVIRARMRAFPHFHGPRERLTIARPDAYDARDADWRHEEINACRCSPSSVT